MEILLVYLVLGMSYNKKAIRLFATELRWQDSELPGKREENKYKMQLIIFHVLFWIIIDKIKV